MIHDHANCLGPGLPSTRVRDHEPLQDEVFATAATDYPGATFYGASSSNYSSSAYRTPITRVVIHVTQGKWQSAIDWFLNAGAQVSAHYTVRASDGHVGQSVRENAVAYHAGNWSYNQSSVGIEHEGYVSQTSFSDAMFRSSAKLTAYLCKKYKIPIDRSHIIGHFEVPKPNTHTDPGPNWPWARYMALVKEYAGATPAKPPVSGVLYRVEVPTQQQGAYREKTGADGVARKLASLKVKALVVPEDGLYKVRVAAQRQGSYREKANADGVVRSLKALGVKATVKPSGAVPAPTPAPAQKSKVDKAIAYMKRLIGPPTPYGFWRGGWPPPANPPNPEWMFFPNGLPNAEDEVPDSNCAGMINLGNAAAGISYRNGTLGYAADLVNKRRYVPGMAVKKGEVLVNDNVSGPGDADRSHIAMYIGGGLVISCDHHLGGLSPGVNIHGLAESHRMFGYEFVGEVPGLGTT